MMKIKIVCLSGMFHITYKAATRGSLAKNDAPDDTRKSNSLTWRSDDFSSVTAQNVDYQGFFQDNDAADKCRNKKAEACSILQGSTRRK